MNLLVDGDWRPDDYELTNDDGEFVRQETTFRDRVGEAYPVESDRYHLYVSRACPWAHGTVLVRKLLGLESVISMDIVDMYRDDDGWQFTPEKDGCTADTVNGFDYLREAYVEANSNVTGRVTVPVLWDKEPDTIVNNESVEIMRMLATGFGAYAERDLDLYPEPLRDDIDRGSEPLPGRRRGDSLDSPGSCHYLGRRWSIERVGYRAHGKWAPSGELISQMLQPTRTSEGLRDSKSVTDRLAYR